MGSTTPQGGGVRGVWNTDSLQIFGEFPDSRTCESTFLGFFFSWGNNWRYISVLRTLHPSSHPWQTQGHIHTIITHSRHRPTHTHTHADTSKYKRTCHNSSKFSAKLEDFGTWNFLKLSISKKYKIKLHIVTDIKEEINRLPEEGMKGFVA